MDIMHAPIIVISLNYTRAKRGQTAEFYRGYFIGAKNCDVPTVFFHPRITNICYNVMAALVCVIVLMPVVERARSGLLTFRTARSDRKVR